MTEKESAGRSRIVVDNAGLVLINPYLPQFLMVLDLLAPNEAGRLDWRCADARGLAVHLLQYLVDGECGRPDSVLTLNKLLCGQPPDQPVAAVEPDRAELALCDYLLSTVLARWTAMSDSSFAALRETFLQRDGEIIETPSGWRVRVERKTVDVLLDQLPWSFSVIHHPWMDKPISVEW